MNLSKCPKLIPLGFNKLKLGSQIIFAGYLISFLVRHGAISYILNYVLKSVVQIQSRYNEEISEHYPEMKVGRDIPVTIKIKPPAKKRVIMIPHWSKEMIYVTKSIIKYLKKIETNSYDHRDQSNGFKRYKKRREKEINFDELNDMEDEFNT